MGMNQHRKIFARSKSNETFISKRCAYVHIDLKKFICMRIIQVTYILKYFEIHSEI